MWHDKSTEEVLRRLKTNAKIGLAEKDVEKRNELLENHAGDRDFSWHIENAVEDELEEEKRAKICCCDSNCQRAKWVIYHKV